MNLVVYKSSAGAFWRSFWGPSWFTEFLRCPQPSAFPRPIRERDRQDGYVGAAGAAARADLHGLLGLHGRHDLPVAEHVACDLTHHGPPQTRKRRTHGARGVVLEDVQVGERHFPSSERGAFGRHQKRHGFLTT